MNTPSRGNSLKWLLLVALAAGCGGSEPSVEVVELKGVDESVGTSESALTGCLAYNTTLQVTASSLNLRSGPSTSYSIVAAMPNGALIPTLDNPSCDSGGWYRVSYSGVTGWASGSYLVVYSAPSGTRDAAITRAASGTSGAVGGVGFSYWWGHGVWKAAQATGSCTGNCGACTHSGSYGADCSGFLAKVWQVPSTNTNVSVDSHPYGTVHFNVDSSQWYTIDRGAMQKADAMVYNLDGAGHTFVYESGDGWGSMVVHECKGCAYGCVKNSRTATTSYHGIRHF
ncbi:SH3 domain-containing protein [Hyalangium minutum]|uniref:Putative Membrane Spanning Protein n=1 Tax=Hyalangium minutum TaxID=394096 RepID=A0A085WL59_9BACT|nr:SH3 domain-containing protein [Hyalangium minutum]KFE68422.1 putative Membrane Spanning Protein [Hyalangium minutum]